MKKSFVGVLILVAFLFSGTGTSMAAIIEIAPYDQGWIKYDGADYTHTVTNLNTYTDRDFYRSFFLFDLSGVTGTVINAGWQYYTWEVSGDGTYLVYDVLDVDLDLLNDATPTAAEWYDLGHGSQYAVMSHLATNDNTTFLTNLSSTAVTDINNATWKFAIGGLYTGAANPYLFGGSINQPHPSFGLILQTTETTSPVPEPATMLLLGSGLLGLAGLSRKKFFKK